MNRVWGIKDAVRHHGTIRLPKEPEVCSLNALPEAGENTR